MTLEDYLWYNGFLDQREYLQLQQRQLELTYQMVRNQTPGLVNTTKPVMGDILQSNEAVRKSAFEKAQVSSIDELIRLWMKWHCQNLEPMSDYPLSKAFGRSLYSQRMEKKRVALAVTGYAIRNHGTIVTDGDSIVIPEGSSAAYLGIACCSYRKNTTIITTNPVVLREIQCNDVLSERCRYVHALGGIIDKGDVGSPIGPEVDNAYVAAIESVPTAGVVIIPSKGLTPLEGPFASTADIGRLKRTIIDAATKSSKVREVVFVSDHTKHDDTKRMDYGQPVYGEHLWRRIREDFCGKISIVTGAPDNYIDSQGINQQAKDAKKFAYVAERFREQFMDKACIVTSTQHV
jgi:hypothetical protein